MQMRLAEAVRTQAQWGECRRQEQCSTIVFLSSSGKGVL